LMSFLLPGTGFGGSCFPKDVKALIAFGGQLGHSMPILSAVIDTNRRQPEVTLDLVRGELGSLAGRRVAVLGLAFKPGTDDVRETPAEPIIRALAAEGATVVAHDPVATDAMKAVLDGVAVDYAPDLRSAIARADAIILVTSWPEYAELGALLDARDVPVIDGRRFLNPAGFKRYRAIGRREIAV